MCRCHLNLTKVEFFSQGQNHYRNFVKIKVSNVDPTLQVLVRYLHQNEVHINQNQQLKLCMEGFLESLISHGCITADEAAALPIKITQHESFNRLVQANQHFEKLLRDNAKIIQSFEKQQVDPALLIYIAGATGKLTNLAFALLNASQNDATKVNLESVSKIYKN